VVQGGGSYRVQNQGNGEWKALLEKIEKIEMEYSESRELAYEEIWDDSALIEAWDAAAEEYEALNGPDKKWKSEPVNKSALYVFSSPHVLSQ